MPPKNLVRFPLKITCQWIGIEWYTLSALFALFTWRNGWSFGFFTHKPFLIISPLFFIILNEFFFLKKGVYMEKRRWGVLGGYSRRRHCRRKKGINFRVIKVSLRFGELEIFQMVQNFNRKQLMPYILIVWRKKIDKVKTGCYRNEKTKNDKKIPSDIEFPRTSTTLPFKIWLWGQFAPKSLPRCPQILCQGGWCIEMWQKLVFRIFKYLILTAVAAKITLFKNYVFSLS